MTADKALTDLHAQILTQLAPHTRWRVGSSRPHHAQAGLAAAAQAYAHTRVTQATASHAEQIDDLREQLAAAGTTIRGQAATIRRLERELKGQQAISDELREQVTGARNELASFGGQLDAAQERIAELEQAARDHLCEPLPQRNYGLRADGHGTKGPEWSEAAREPASAPAEALDGPRKAPAARKPRNPVRGKGDGPQAVTDAPGGAA